MSEWISLPRTEGISSKQAHADLPENSYERELGQDGFSGPATQMYHRHPPCNWTSVSGPLQHHAFDTALLGDYHSSPWMATPLLHNSNLRLRFWACDVSMNSLVRNADGDELVFIHYGEGELFCDYGHLHFSEGDYILIPKGTLWRIEIKRPVKCLLIEATQDHYRLPDKGLVGAHAIFDPAVLETPEINQAFKEQQSEDEWIVQIKHLNELSEMRTPCNPLDALGWHGNLVPVKLNWRDIRPLMSHRYHLPPSAHTTFICDRFLISTFVPRPLESDPGALRVPFYHSNDDYDEVIFYHAGKFFSRDNIDSGMISFHPAGIPHGPHPEACEAGKNYTRKETDEVAIMIDARYPLQISPQARAIECRDYMNSWQKNRGYKK
ncbi:Homogentisate 1,2-dioxygenase [hydrothermal vent metagenome]|uniref:Homogentisate 1,2-dioxygenase n=1 Tax=hydrothermal vent metagenome TaxID=652676 RepID=A0A3B0X7W8_9ZZZZ